MRSGRGAVDRGWSTRSSNVSSNRLRREADVGNGNENGMGRLGREARSRRLSIELFLSGVGLGDTDCCDAFVSKG